MRRKSDAVYVSREMITNPAFLALTGKAPQVLMLFLTKRVVSKLKRAGPRGERYEVVNNGQIEFTYLEAERKYGLTMKRFRHAIDELVGKGFLDIAKQGGGLEGDKSLYALSSRWRFYDTSDFEPRERPRGRRWTTRPTSLKGRGGTSLKGRGSPEGTALKGRGSGSKQADRHVPKGTYSIESTSPSNESQADGREQSEGTTDSQWVEGASVEGRVGALTGGRDVV